MDSTPALAQYPDGALTIYHFETRRHRLRIFADNHSLPRRHQGACLPSSALAMTSVIA